MQTRSQFSIGIYRIYASLCKNLQTPQLELYNLAKMIIFHFLFEKINKFYYFSKLNQGVYSNKQMIEFVTFFKYLAIFSHLALLHEYGSFVF